METQQRTRRFLVYGLKPAYGGGLIQMLKNFDLGVEVAFVKFTEVVTATLEEGVTKDQLSQQAEAIKSAYQHVGYENVTAIPLDKKEQANA